MHKSKFENENEALSCLAEGDFAAYNFIYHKYCQLIYGNICKYIRDTNVAEDILQEVFITLWEKRETIKCDIPVGGWLFRVSYNKSIALLKKQLRHQIMMADSAYLAVSEIGQMDAAEKENLHQYKISLLEEAVNCLPAKKQKVYRLNKFEHKKPEEISEELGLTVISVKHYLKQSTQLIKQYVQFKYPVEIFLLFCTLLEVLNK